MTAPATTAIPFTWTDPDDPTRVLRGVVDAPAFAAEPLTPVFVLHGFKGFFRWGFFPLLAERIAQAGFAAVRFNFSGSGVGADLESFTEDAAFEANTPLREREDAERLLGAVMGGSAVELPFALRAPVGLVGHSMGGALALLLAGGAAPVPVGAAVAWAAVASFDRFTPEQRERLRAEGWLPIPNVRTGQLHRLGRGWVDTIETAGAALDPVQACASVSAPTLLLHGTADTSVPLEEGERLASQLPAGLGRLVTRPQAGHTFGAKHPPADAVPDELAWALDHTEEHLRRHLD